MRNLLDRTFLLAAAVLLAITLLGSDLSARPAGAAPAARVAAASGSVRLAPRHRPWSLRYRQRASRSGFRTAASAVPDDVWERLRACESGGRYDINTGNGFYGAYQFHPRTWRTLGYPGLPHEASPETQDEAAHRLQARSGWGQWPVCSRRIGAR